ncbi:substrate-binding domain-containing protein [Oceanimonas sp. CHS3-5]|uniref:substrate-binding domain-containing protein n=1 Tax=Oceanimonas sp. CHS3-5 TaxID=3068186 RepID=UPI00273F424E|nr:substrate-binding domain-containing protein [Oceanimonas sp. CHS3-5]MDP5293470.1 substrate-binding domain-containing protein [Oceanimonas sp. CHS3-5]
MRLLFTALLSMLLLSGGSLARGQDYWTYRDYLKAFPEQRQLTDAFAARVRQPALPWHSSRTPPVRIAMLTPDAQISDYWSRNRLSLSRRLQEIGLPYSLKSYSFQPATTLRQQEALLAKALNSQPDYLIFTVNALRHRVLVEKIIARGHPKLILMNITTPLKSWAKRQPFFYVGFDHREGTRLLTETIARMTGARANYLMLYGTQGYVSQARGDEFIRLTANQPGFALRQAFYTDVERNKARQAVQQALTTAPDINLVYACTTDIALGAAESLRAQGKKDKVLLNGWGGGSAELDALARGDLDLTVMRMNDDNGVAMAEAIRLDQEGKAHRLPQVYSGDFAVIDRHTPADELERLKAHAFRYSR